jgi:hypothetical protein
MEELDRSLAELDALARTIETVGSAVSAGELRREPELLEALDRLDQLTTELRRALGNLPD